MDSKKSIPLLTLSALLFSLFAAEIYLRHFPTPWLYMEMRNIVQQESSMPVNDDRGYAPQPHYEGIFKNQEFKTRVRINPNGFRDDDYPLAKPVGIKRVAVLGDSFAFGWGVEAHERFSEILEMKSHGTMQYLNFGVSGYCESQSLTQLKLSAIPFAPDQILFLTYGMPRNCKPANIFNNGRMYWESTASWTWRQKLLHSLKKRSYLITLMDQARRQIRSWFFYKNSARASSLEKANSNQPDASLTESRQILQMLSDLSKKYAMPVTVVFVPSKTSVVERIHANDEVADRKLLAAWAKQEGLGWIDLTEPLRKATVHGQPPYFSIDDHWNRTGHQIVAETLHQWQTSNFNEHHAN